MKQSLFLLDKNRQTTVVMGDRKEQGCPYDKNCKYWPDCLANLDSYGKCSADEPDRIGEQDENN